MALACAVDPDAVREPVAHGPTPPDDPDDPDPPDEPDALEPPPAGVLLLLEPQADNVSTVAAIAPMAQTRRERLTRHHPWNRYMLRRARSRPRRTVGVESDVKLTRR
jgi:hypothetical protein